MGSTTHLESLNADLESPHSSNKSNTTSKSAKTSLKSLGSHRSHNTAHHFLKHSISLCKRIIHRRRELSMSVLSDIEKELYNRLQAREGHETEEASAEVKGIILEIISEAYHYSIPPKLFWKFLANLLAESNENTRENILKIIYPIFTNIKPSKHLRKVTDDSEKLIAYKCVLRRFWMENDTFSCFMFENIRRQKCSYDSLKILWAISFTPEALNTRITKIIDALINALKNDIIFKELRLCLKILHNLEVYNMFDELSLNQLSLLSDHLKMHYERNAHFEKLSELYNEILKTLNELITKLQGIIEKKLDFSNYLSDLEYPLLPSEIHTSDRFWNANIHKLMFYRPQLIAKYSKILRSGDPVSCKIVISDLNRLLGYPDYSKELVKTCNDLNLSEDLLIVYKLDDIELKVQTTKVMNKFLSVQWCLSENDGKK